MKLEHKQPRSLYLLFFIELWERFSFYGLQAVLVLYLIKSFGLSDTNASTMYGTFVALGFTLPILGGFLADKYIGHQRAILLGSLFIIFANIVLSLPHYSCVIWGLALLITGTGLFKSNVSSLLGSYYGVNDPRRNSGFTLFYMGINCGAAGGPFVYGEIAQNFGFSTAFIAGSIGMLIGYLVFLAKKSTLKHETHSSHRRVLSLKQYLSIALGIMMIVFIAVMLIQSTVAIRELLLLLGSALLLFQLIISYKIGGHAGKNLLALTLLTLLGMFFYTIILQLGSSFTLFTERNVARSILGYTIPSASFESLEAFTVIAFSPILAWLWLHLSIKKIELTAPTKFAIGMLLAGSSFAILSLGAKTAAVVGFCSPLYILFMYMLQGIGDIILSPTGLSAVSTLALPNHIGFFMGVWMVGIAMGGFLAGKISTLLVGDVPMLHLSPEHQAMIFYQLFRKEFAIAMIITLIAFAFIPLINYLMKKTDTTTENMELA